MHVNYILGKFTGIFASHALGVALFMCVSVTPAELARVPVFRPPR
jgi:hypothetical protein